MDVRFRPHNLHWQRPAEFEVLDPHLSSLRELPLVYRFPLLGSLPRDICGVYSITGGRQVGKTTLLKQYMADLIASGVPPNSVFYLPGELLDDHHALVGVLSEYVDSPASGDSPRFILLDEVTYIKDWDRGVKYLADAGLLRRAILILTGSDTVVIRDARMRFPGRRGRADRVDFHLFPLTFAEYAVLKRGISLEDLKTLTECAPDSAVMAELEATFETYLLHGGYLTAINELESRGAIGRSTFATYSDWIRGDVLKRGKQEHYLRDILQAVVRRTGSQLTWNTLVGEISIDHPATVADYVGLLSRMDALIVQQALREDKLKGAPKKARKVHFADPFIFHATRAWLCGAERPYEQIVLPLLAAPEARGAIVESCAVAHFNRFYPTYYIKGAGEVDIAYVRKGRFWPVEVKWTTQIRAAHLKQASKYPNSIICARAGMPPQVHGIACQPLVKVLVQLGPSPPWLHDD